VSWSFQESFQGGLQTGQCRASAMPSFPQLGVVGWGREGGVRLVVGGLPGGSRRPCRMGGRVYQPRLNCRFLLGCRLIPWLRLVFRRTGFPWPAGHHRTMATPNSAQRSWLQNRDPGQPFMSSQLRGPPWTRPCVSLGVIRGQGRPPLEFTIRREFRRREAGEDDQSSRRFRTSGLEVSLHFAVPRPLAAAPLVEVRLRR